MTPEKAESGRGNWTVAAWVCGLLFSIAPNAYGMMLVMASRGTPAAMVAGSALLVFVLVYFALLPLLAMSFHFYDGRYSKTIFTIYFGPLLFYVTLVIIKMMSS